MAKRKSPKGRSDARAEAPSVAPYKPTATDKMMSKVHSALGAISSVLRLADEKVSIPELKGPQAAFRKRVKRATAVLAGKED